MNARRERMFQHLVDAFEKARNERLSNQMRAQKVVTTESRTLGALNDFRQDRLSQRRERNAAPERSVSVPQQITESRFDSRLVEAIKSQNTKLDRAREVSAASQAALQQAQRKLTAMNLLLERQKQRARRKELAAEQKLTDELASQKAFTAGNRGR